MTYTVPFVFMNSFIPLISNISLQSMLTINTILLIIEMLLIYWLGRLLLRYPADKIMLTASLLLACTAVPLFIGFKQPTLAYVTLVRCWIVVLGVVFLCPLNYWYNQLFTSRERFLLIGMGGALGSATIGRLVPAICLAIWHTTNHAGWIGVFIMVIALGAAFAIKATTAAE